MRKRFVDDFEVILLDQGQTFMFENDRFGADADYHETYRNLGGHHLSEAEIRDVVDLIFARLQKLARDPRRYDSFPSIRETLRDCEMTTQLEEADLERIDEVFARHEVGTISKRHAKILHALADSHRLGILSNVWGGKAAFEENLERAGVRELFEHRVWSSERGRIKPSRELFRHVIALFGVEADRVLFVGDHPMRDIDAAKVCGCAAVWVQGEAVHFPAGYRRPDLTIKDLEELIYA